MLWDRRNDDELPEELRGKKPNEIAAEMRKAKELETKLAVEEQARRETEAKLTATTTEFDTIKAKLADVEARLTPPPPEPALEEPASPWIDPHKFVQEQTKPVADVALQAGVMSAKLYFSQGLTARDQKIFRKYEKEVDAMINTFQPQARVYPQSWMNAFLYVKGLHDMDIANAEKDKTDYFSETPSRGSSPEPAPEDKLTPDEEETCRVMRWDPKGYLEQKKRRTVSASSKGEYARFSTTK